MSEDCKCGGFVDVFMDTDTKELFARCTKCEAEGPRLPGPTLPLPVSKFVEAVEKTSGEAKRLYLDSQKAT